ncbi:MAG: EAL domain-containing protein [Planctomycetota bacterium]|nr:EAL domain-containing protein [Planctomycetota bacterium]
MNDLGQPHSNAPWKPVLPIAVPASDGHTRGNRHAPTILVVDDDPATREILACMLSLEGYDVLEAGNGRKALAIIKESVVDLVLLDIQMPEMDGFRFNRMLRQMFDLSELPVVMMTASDVSEKIIEAFDCGVNDYVCKPIDRPILLARIKTQLRVRAAQRELRDSEARYALVSLGTNDGVWDWNLITGELYLSPRWRAMVGVDDPNWNPRGADWLVLVHREDRKRVLTDLEAHLCGETSHFETELRMQDRIQGHRWMLCRGLAIKDSSGLACRIAGSLTDITEGKVADALTGLPNRMLFHDRVERCVEKVQRRQSRSFAILYLDVDDFKLINDQFGHDGGDLFLVSFSERLDNAIRKSDAVLARIGGDEFAILLESIRGLDDAILVAKRLQEALMTPFKVGGRDILVRASVGIAIADSTSQNYGNSSAAVDLLLTQADAAMYQAKTQLDSSYCVFQSEMLDATAAKLELAGELRYAIERNELTLVYQPIVGLSTTRTEGFEALLRWLHPVYGYVPPNEFIPIAESKGLIVEIGEWVLREACQQAVRWRNEFQRDVMVSVNVSIRQLTSDGFVKTVIDILDSTQLSAGSLKLEVTESLLMQQPEQTIAILRLLREIGTKISIDDFGTGYSSLAYLHQMPLDVLKVDRSFVNGMFDSEKHLAIVRTIIGLASSLQLQVIAEGVETVEQLQKLQSLGCDMIQGYFLSKPIPAADAIKLLERNWEWPQGS